MAVLGPRLKIAVIGLVALGSLALWLSLLFHEKQACNVEIVSRDHYQVVIDRYVYRNKRMPAKPRTQQRPDQQTETEDEEANYAVWRAQSRENLRVIAMALQRYAAAHGRPPPLAVRGKDGQLLYSWRVLLLPYLDQGEEVYRQFQLDEPWDSPRNKKLLMRIPPVYAQVRRTAKEPQATFYQILSVPGSAAKGWPADSWLLVEAGEAVPWTKPEDVGFPSETGPIMPALGGLFADGFHLAFADGKVCFVPRTISEDILKDISGRQHDAASRVAFYQALLEHEATCAYREKLTHFWIEQLEGRLPIQRRQAIASLADLVQENPALCERGADGQLLVPALVEALADEDQEVRDQAEKTLVGLGSAAVPFLANNLRHADPQVRGAVADILARATRCESACSAAASELLAERRRRLRTAWARVKTGPYASRAVLDVLEALKDRDRHIRANAALQLSSLGVDASYVVFLLIKRLEESSLDAKAGRTLAQNTDHDTMADPSLAPAREAAQALGELGAAAKAAIPALIRFVERHPSEHIAVAALMRIGPDAGPELIEAVQRPGDHQPSLIKVLGNAKPTSARAIAALRTVLGKGPPVLRAPAAEALGNIGPDARSAIPELLLALDDIDPVLRLHAARAIVRIDASHAQGVNRLCEALHGDDPRLALQAAVVMTDSDDALRFLVKAIFQSDEQHGFRLSVHEHRRAVEALCHFGEIKKKVVSAMKQRALDHLNPDAALILAHIDPEAALPVLRKLVKEGGRTGQEAAINALGILGPEAKAIVPDLIEMLRHPRSGRDVLHEKTAITLARIDPETAIPFLVRGICGEASSARYPYYETLKSLGPKGATAAPALVSMLKNDNDIETRWAANLLAGMGQAAVPHLIEALQDALGSQAVELSSIFLTVLGRLGPEAREAVPVLLELAQDRRPELRMPAIRALGNIAPNDPAAFALLKNALGDPDPEVRCRAALALGKAGLEAIPALEAALRDADAEVRCATVMAFRTLGHGSTAALLVALKDEHFEVRRLAVLSLDAMDRFNTHHEPENSSRAQTALITALEDSDKTVRWLAAAALSNRLRQPIARAPAAQAGNREVALGLTKALQDRDTEIRWLAAFSLGSTRNEVEQIVPALAKALQDSSLLVRRAAALSLQEMGAEARAAIPALQNALHDPRLGLMREAAQALAQAGPQGVQALASELKHKDRRVRAEAADALVRLGPEAVPVLLDRIQDADRDARTEAAIALGRIAATAEEVVPTVLEALSSKADRVRSVAARAIGEIGPGARDAVPQLTELLDHAEPSVRWNAIWALGRIGPDAHDAIPALRKVQQDDDPLIRSAAVDALAKIRGQGVPE